MMKINKSSDYIGAKTRYKKKKNAVVFFSLSKLFSLEFLWLFLSVI